MMQNAQVGSSNIPSFKNEEIQQRIEFLRQHDPELESNAIDLNELLSHIQQLLDENPTDPQTLELIDASLSWIATNPDPLLNLLYSKARSLNQAGELNAAIEVGKRCLPLAPNNPQVLLSVAYWMQHITTTENLTHSIPLAQQALDQSENILSKISASHLACSALLSISAPWQESLKYYQIHKHLLETLVNQLDSEPSPIDRVGLPAHLTTGALLLYFEDAPKTNRSIRNRLATACTEEAQRQGSELGRVYPRQVTAHSSTRSLRIGYLSGCLRQHSVGWLSRWLLHHHDRDRYDIHLYSLLSSQDAIQYNLKQVYGDRFHSLQASAYDIANQIYQDGIDILVEMDSLTSLSGCHVLSLKPAPVQVQWLGYDASGIPTTDYFIADPYVLPEDAQTDYQEKIWRLSQTYIAVDGFEVGTASLRRDHLNIPADAIVYLSSQTGLKRNPDNIRLQLKILKAVPNSYFLIKSQRAQLDQLAAFFGQYADEVGVSRDRLRFMPDAPSELTHRANLALADIVLDTYPYNGATTTLEALWIGLPIVTRVGEQFAARNSYTMMMNAGISQGISWSDTEYLEWGIRLGTDEKLRSQVAYQLSRSRHTAPLWNGRQFARDMEQAYEQMWQIYCSKV